MTDSPSPQESADHTAPASEPAASAPPPRPRRTGAILFGALIGAALVAGGVWLGQSWQAGRTNPALAALTNSLSALQSQFTAANADRDALRRDLAALRADLAPLGDRIAAARAGADPAALAEAQKQIADLTARVDAAARTPLPPPGADPAAVAALDRRIGAMEAALIAAPAGAAPDPAARAAAEALATRLANAERALAVLRANVAAAANLTANDALLRQVAALAARLDDMERTARAGPLAAPPAAAPAGARGDTVVAYATQLRERMRGNGRFAAELSALRAAVGPGDPALNAALASVEPLAAGGVPTSAELARRLAGAENAVFAAADGEPAGWTDAVLRGVRSLVRVRRPGDAVPDGNIGRIERARALLLQGDAAGAVALVEQASPAAQAVLADWLGQAHARAALDEAGAVIAARAAALVAAPGPVGPLPGLPVAP
jgi:hypothetical protein